MQLNDKFEILQNPGFEFWEEHLANIYKYEGWTYSKHDFNSWKAAFGDRVNHFALVEKDTKKYIGGVFSATYTLPKLLAVGMYFLLPEYRGLGLGLPLWDRGIAGDVENKALIAAEKMSPKYALRDGFDKIIEWDLKKTSIQIKDVDSTKLDIDTTLKTSNFKEVDFEKLMEFDRKITGGLERAAYIKEFFTQPGAYNKVVISQEGEILGYCNIRECYHNNLVVGPFYAQNLLVASTILRAALESIPNLNNFEILKMAVPSSNSDAKKLFDILSTGKCKIDAKNFIQFTNHLMNIPGDKIYAVTDCTVSYA
uniref:YitH acetyltransferase (GNAT) domain-containing protein n=1 Tax=Acrobeloides nanus TaxID=290746 RepID=A0A914DCV0_9BILA